MQQNSKDDNVCENCIYARDFEEILIDVYPMQIICKRYPPKCVEIRMNQYGSSPRVVYRSDWCGEFANKHVG